MSPLWLSLPASADEVCRRFARDAEAPPPGGSPPREYFERLCGEEQYRTAIGFLAHALPVRAAVWWGCLCVWDAARPSLPQPVDAALGAALRWVLNPIDELRRAAENAAAGADDTPAGYLAQAVFFSGGSLLASNLPVLEPPPFLANRVLAGTILMAAAQAPAADDEHLRLFLHWGSEIADGKLHWSQT
jgi:hypothetical protein